MLSHVITAAVSTGAGALLRQPEIDALNRDLDAAYKNTNNLAFKLQRANETIQRQAEDRLRSEVLFKAEIARLMELIPPTDASE